MRGSAGIFGLFVIVAFLISGALAAETLTNDAVVTMVKTGLGEELIISKVKAAEGQYDLSVDGILMLKRDGVSEAIIKAMVETSASKVSSAPAKMLVHQMMAKGLVMHMRKPVRNGDAP